MTIESVNPATGETTIFEPEEEELNALPTTLAACEAFDLLTAGLEAIGPNPTSEELVSLMAGGFTFDQTGSPSGSTGADKAYTSDHPGLIYDWDGIAFIPRS